MLRFASTQLAVLMYPCSMSATGLPRESRAVRKSRMCPRMADATCCSRSLSPLSSGYLSCSTSGVPESAGAFEFIGKNSYLWTLALSVPLSP
jgi:hypothetical protein